VKKPSKHKRITADGKVWYYYPKKKKVGRKKKRGPKKKRVRRKLTPKVKQNIVFDYKIISSINGKQNSYVGKYCNINDAYAELEKLKAQNESVVFPRKYVNSTEIIAVKDEYLLLEKNRDGSKKDSMLRNEFGKFIPQKITNNKKWVIREKIIRLVEETFWVYGFDSKTDRKTFAWIWDNLVLNRIQNSYDVIRFLVFKNKIIIRYDNEQLSMILCKNGSDAIRMYNLMSDNVDKLKNKQIVGVGAYNVISDKRRELESDIMELTGWSKSKIQRPTN
jgi:hypothetical protein